MSALFAFTYLPVVAYTTEFSSCTRICTSSKPCGDKCIPKDETCTEIHGGACYPQIWCDRICDYKPCGDTCINNTETCTKIHGKACARDVEDRREL